MVLTGNLACKEEAVDISYPFDAFFAKQDRWLAVFLPFVAHFSTFVHKYKYLAI